MLCVTMKSWAYNWEAVQMPLQLHLQNLQGKGDGGWGKSVSASFFSWPSLDSFQIHWTAEFLQQALAGKQ